MAIVLTPNFFTTNGSSVEYAWAGSGVVTVTFVLVVTTPAACYFVYEVSPRGWDGTGIRHIMMTHALPAPGYELIVEAGRVIQ